MECEFINESVLKAQITKWRKPGYLLLLNELTGVYLESDSGIPFLFHHRDQTLVNDMCGRRGPCQPLTRVAPLHTNLRDRH